VLSQKDLVCEELTQKERRGAFESVFCWEMAFGMKKEGPVLEGKILKLRVGKEILAIYSLHIRQKTLKFPFA